MRSDTLPELAQLERVLEAGADHLATHVACRVQDRGRSLPVYAITLGSPDPRVPAVAFVGGVHGLERIGARVVIAFFASLVGRLSWDAALHHLLGHVRVLFMPIVNPGGMLRGARALPGPVTRKTRPCRR